MTNFEHSQARALRRVEEARQALTDHETAFTIAVDHTRRLLAMAAELGATEVGIGKLPSDRKDFPFTPGGSVFTNSDARTPNGWPVAWKLTEDFKIDGESIGYGAGNTGQHQADTRMLVDGVYELREGVWHRTDLSEED